MNKITFLGASGMVTGSSYLLSDNDGTNILVDMGMFQGMPKEEAYNTAPLTFDPRILTAVILTHAHIDHCGRLPLLVRNGFSGRIYMTAATRDILEVTLMDSSKISAQNSKFSHEPALYDESDVFGVIASSETRGYHQPFDIARYTGEFFDAGHILGSASLLLTNRGGGYAQKIAFSGDLGNSPQDLLSPTENIPAADTVIMESTYGDRAHPVESPRDIIAKEVAQVESQSGTLLIPAFSIERTQVLLHLFGHMKAEGVINPLLPVFLDSPMAQKITEIYRKFSDLYSRELTDHARHSNPFDFPGLHIVERYPGNQEIRKKQGPKVIIAGSGMMSGGRILDHASRFLPYRNTRLLFVGYQAVDTLGREILEGERRVWIYGKQITISASVTEAKNMSAHADQPRLLAWLSRINGVKSVFLTHGEDGPRLALTQKIQEELGIASIHMPKMYEHFQL